MSLDLPCSCKSDLCESRSSDGKSEVQSLVSFGMARNNIGLVRSLLLACQLAPLRLLLLVQSHKHLALKQHDHAAQRADGDQHFVAGLVVGQIPSAVDLRADQRSDLYDYVVCSGGDGALFHIEGVF